MKKPVIRFEGYNDDWEQRKLSDIAERVQKNDGRMGLPTLTISAGNGWMSQQDRFSDNIAGKEKKNYTLLHKGELSYNHGNSKLAKYGAVFELRDYEEALVPRVYHSFRMIENNSPSFIEYMFATRIPDRELRKMISSGARMDGLLNINFDEFFSINVNIPCHDEQHKIAEYFRKFDALIDLHQHECDQAKKLKKAMLQQMFPKEGETVPEIRFDEFTDDWEQRKWMDTVDISVNMVDPKSGKYDNLPHIAPGNIESFTGQLYDNIKTVGDEKLISGKFHFYPDDIIYGKINPQLGKYYYSNTEGLTSADAYVLNAKNGLNQKYLFAILQTEEFYKYSVSVSMRSGMPKINRDELNAYSFMAPSYTEQEQIGEFFLNADKAIALRQRKLKKLQDLKSAMLNKMFV